MEEETKICKNCKREIPLVNYVVHEVHCARNIKMCPVCKEPVPLSELDQHHEKQHKMGPCKFCGEGVCGTDMEDHIRDSCAHTVRPCRYCGLELARTELPAHESYCGARTERCAECRAYVMLRYRQLHLDSNHGFIKLDEDPEPGPNGLIPISSRFPPLRPIPRRFPTPHSNQSPFPSSSTNLPTNTSNSGVKTTNLGTNSSNSAMKTTNVGANTSSFNANLTSEQNIGGGDSSRSDSSPEYPQEVNEAAPSGVKKRDNDQPQLNIAASTVKNKSSCRGAVKKRPAPRPPRDPPRRDPVREAAYNSAVRRHRHETDQRRLQNEYNLAHGLPPVLTPAEKIEKLRKMDALQNPQPPEDNYKNILQGRVWRSSNVPTGHLLGYNTESTRTAGTKAGNANTPEVRVQSTRAAEDVNNFRDLKPMTESEFLSRFQEIQMAGGDRADRFSEIKSSLRELRRGLNEVTAPYNANAANNVNDQTNSDRQPSPSSANPEREPSPNLFVNRQPSPNILSAPQLSPSHNNIADRQHSPNNRQHSPNNRQHSPNIFADRPNSPSFFDESSLDAEDNEVLLPCEFCGTAVAAHDLVQHQTGCRPDLAQLRASLPAPAAADTLIPCEFCGLCLPLHALNQHQSQCDVSAESRSGSASPPAGPRSVSPPAPPAPLPGSPSPPVIPCEFCTESLPVYLITEHQERCQRESNNILYPD